ncbi:MAG: DNA primase [uncultured Nocardioidaceae bacterium]|uniref:DNA primase n=1 Tax=uncultured Nocardioidaceae bacterium TaxID=253824 RepID=A0A6J4MZC4_9ACTN|nr:MAG: DNA primase [uncultured Nocardioidaceae bacterium]
MAGRIREDDIALVRERSRIDEVVSAHVTLRNAGGGSLKGLCPFHEEKTPSFNVNPARGFYHCFGCQEGGDVISFVQKVEGVGFGEAVERLAGRYSVSLRYDDNGAAAPRRDPGQRARLVAAHRAAAEFYVDALSTPEALAGRQFLSQRGFDQTAAQRFNVGFAPRGNDALLRHLRGRGFSEDELVTSGLVVRGHHGPYDRFRGRLLWPIRELSGDVVGFGARRLFDDDRIEAKYLNTPETPIYKKSHLLYGADLARKEIALSSQAVVVEGYTDVMACHLSGVQTAVATCGTAFGDDHARILRRLLLDHDEFRGEIIFTFDGDAAGQKAALKAFQGDQQFVGQTYVAIEPDGRDPCDLRLAQGDAAVRELIARRVPLYRFVLSSVVSRFDLDRADARVDAMREAVRLVAAIRDRSKVEAFAREVAGMVGVDLDEVRAEVRRASGRPTSRGSGSQRRPGGRPDSAEASRAATTSSADQPTEPSRGGPARAEIPDPRDRRFSMERDVLKLVLQHPDAVSEAFAATEPEDFTHPWYRELCEAVSSLGGPQAATSAGLVATLGGGASTQLVSALSVEPLAVQRAPDARVATEFVVRLRELTALRRIQQVKSRLQRMSPVTQVGDYNRLFGELVALEAHRRALREQAIGSGY